MEKILKAINEVEQDIETTQRSLEPAREKALDDFRQEMRALATTHRQQLEAFKEDYHEHLRQEAHGDFEAIYQEKLREMERLKALSEQNYETVKEQLKQEVLNHGYR